MARVLRPGGRFAVSDVVLESPLPAVPHELAAALCLRGDRSRTRLRALIESAGMTIEDEKDHHDDVLALRDRAFSRVDVRGILDALGPQAAPWLGALDAIGEAVEDGSLTYVSWVASRGLSAR